MLDFLDLVKTLCRISANLAI